MSRNPNGSLGLSPAAQDFLLGGSPQRPAATPPPAPDVITPAPPQSGRSKFTMYLSEGDRLNLLIAESRLRQITGKRRRELTRADILLTLSQQLTDTPAVFNETAKRLGGVTA